MTRERIATITDSVTALGMKLAGMGEVAALDEGEPAGELILKYANDRNWCFVAKEFIRSLS